MSHACRRAGRGGPRPPGRISGQTFARSSAESKPSKNTTQLAPHRALPAAPLGVPDSCEEHVKLMFDLQVLAFMTETTRVSAFKMSRDVSTRVFPESGVTQLFHTLLASWREARPDRGVREAESLSRQPASLFPGQTEEDAGRRRQSAGSFDRSVRQPDGRFERTQSSTRAAPDAGHACGQINGNLHRICAPGTPQANCLLTILHKLGVDVATVGDSTGEIAI